MSNNSENYIEINLANFFNFFFKNFFYFIRNFVLISIFLILIFYIYEINKSQETKYIKGNLLIQSEEVANNIDQSFLFNAEIFLEAVEESGLTSQVVVDKQFMNSFELIPGHTGMNKLIDHYLKQDFDFLVKQLKHKREEIDQLLDEIIQSSSQYLILSANVNSLQLDEIEIKLLIKNLVDSINVSLRKEYDTSDIGLKFIGPIRINTPISSLDVNHINSRLSLLNNYIAKLNLDYKSFAPNINLDVLSNVLNDATDVFNYVIQENTLYVDLVKQKLDLQIEAIDRLLQANLERLSIMGFQGGTQNNGIGTAKEGSSVMYDSSFLDTILDLGNKASAIEDKNNVLQDYATLYAQKVELQRRESELMVRYQLNLSQDEAMIYLTNMLDQTAEQINEYISIVQNGLRMSEPVRLVSLLSSNTKSLKERFMIPVISILILSMLISFIVSSFQFSLQRTSKS